MPKTSTPSLITTASAEEVKHSEPLQETENTPREHVIRNILSFSASLKVEESKQLGKVVLNSN